ncbi:MAG TPA: outer membrane beta-barrel protein [Vicinamibacterales bacterium]
MQTNGRVIVLVLLLLLAAVRAFAQEQADPSQQGRFQWGAIRFTPGIAITDVGFDSNIFNGRDALGDTTAGIGPAINLWTNLGPVRISEKSSGQYLYFKEYDNQRSWNTTNEAKIEWPMTRLRPFAVAGYANAKQRPSFDIDTRVRAVANLATVGTDVIFSSRTTLVLSGTRTTTAFGQKEIFLGSDLANALNRHSDTEQLELKYRLTPLTTLVVASDAVQDRFENDRLRNTDSIAIRPRFEFKPFALIAGSVSVGYRHFNVLNDRVQDYQGPVANVDASYTLTTSTQIHGTVSRDIVFSYDENFPYFALTNSGVTITQRIAGSWDVVTRGAWQTLGYRTLTTGVADVPLDERGKMYGLGVGYRLGESFRIGFDANYYRRRSQASARNFDGLRAGMSLTYGISQ